MWNLFILVWSPCLKALNLYAFIRNLYLEPLWNLEPLSVELLLNQEPLKCGTFLWNLGEPEPSCRGISGMWNLFRAEPLWNLGEPGSRFSSLPQTKPKLCWKDHKHFKSCWGKKSLHATASRQKTEPPSSGLRHFAHLSMVFDSRPVSDLARS